LKFARTKNIVMSLLVISLAACATGAGTASVTGEKRAPLDPGLVNLYLEAPTNYEVIGLVNASSDAGWTEQKSQDYAVQELKNQAAKLGANGVLLESTGERTSTVVGGYGTNFVYAIPVTAKTVSGKAIFIGE
jgi:hypothetical protein